MARKSSLCSLALLLAWLAAGCDDDGEAERLRRKARSQQARAEQAAVAPDEPAAPRTPTPAWPAEVQDLAASLEQLESAEACRKGLRERMPTAVAEVVADIGYDALVDDVCAGLLAVKRGDPEACDALTISALQKGCRRRLAAVHGRPEACPDDGVVDGRDPVCLAWASRDPGLCRGAGVAQRTPCRAVLAGDPSACEPVRGNWERAAGGAATDSDTARCVARVRRYAGALGEERRESAAGELEPVFVLAPATEQDDVDAGEERIASDALERGVHLEARGCAWRVALADPLRSRPSPLDDEPFLRAELEIPAAAELPLEVAIGPEGASLEASDPERPRQGTAPARGGTITVTAFSPEWGAELAGELEARFGPEDGERPFAGRFRTFVRDLAALPARCTEDAPPELP